MIALALAAGLLTAPGSAQEHLVSPEAADARLAGAAAQRSHDVATLEAALSHPVAARTAATLGANLDTVRQAVPTLSDAELRDLARRAEALRSDPVAGLDHDIELLLIVFLVVAIVILLIQAAD
jgi:hypothetical protein